MFFTRRDLVYEVRSATPDDADAVQQLLAGAWRVYLRTPPYKVLLQLRRPELGWVAGEVDSLSGFMLAEIQPPPIAFITAAAVGDDWSISSYINTFLPTVEEAVRSKGASALVHVGYAPWLTGVLHTRGFLSRDWVVTYEWRYQPVTVRGNRSVKIRSAHLRDLPALLALDQSIFGPLWHKPVSSFEEALAQAFVFTVVEEDDQIVGYQWCDKHERRGHLTRLAVKPGWEGKGIGTRLLTEALAALVKADVNWITLNTQESNLRSRMLYERHNFQQIGDRVAVLWKDL
jgi:ribosomal-protein-alanine N-acetyltransferase